MNAKDRVAALTPGERRGVAAILEAVELELTPYGWQASLSWRAPRSATGGASLTNWRYDSGQHRSPQAALRRLAYVLTTLGADEADEV